MKMLACLMLMAGAAQAADPVNVTLVSFVTDHAYEKPCESSWYQDRFKTWRMFQYEPLSCWNGLKGDTGLYHGFAAKNFSEKAIVAVSFAAPVTTVTVRQVYGLGDYANHKGDVEVSFDFGVTWVASSRDAWGPPTYDYKPVFWCKDYSGCTQKATLAWSAAAPYPVTVVWVRGKKYWPSATVSWLPDIAVVQGN